jgi:hypothetical protein
MASQILPRDIYMGYNEAPTERIEMFFYFELTENNVDFAAAINNGLRPSVLDEAGKRQYFIVYEDGETPNDIVSIESYHSIAPNGRLVVISM